MFTQRMSAELLGKLHIALQRGGEINPEGAGPASPLPLQRWRMKSLLMQREEWGHGAPQQMEETRKDVKEYPCASKLIPHLYNI